MSTSFYNRYIPPIGPIKDVNVPDRPKKRPKLDKHAERPLVQVKSRDDEGTGSSHDISKSVNEKSNVPESPSNPIIHESILQKFQRSKDITHRIAAQSTGKDDELAPLPLTSETTKDQISGLQPLPQPISDQPIRPVSAAIPLPSWARNINKVEVDLRDFHEFDLHPCIKSYLEAEALSNATSIQTAVLETLLPGLNYHFFDVCIQAPTGSGKTLAYALPLVQSLVSRHGPFLTGVVVLPTVPLVEQTLLVLQGLSHGTHLNIVAVTGNEPRGVEARRLVSQEQEYNPQKYAEQQNSALNKDEMLARWDPEEFKQRPQASQRYNHIITDVSLAHILICTPWALVDHVQSTHGFTLGYVEWLIMDEADQLINNSFRQWLDVILPLTGGGADPFARPRHVRKVVLSAAMQRELPRMQSALHLYQPKLIVAGIETGSSEGDTDLELDAMSSPMTKASMPHALQEKAIKVEDAAEKPLVLFKELEAILADVSDIVEQNSFALSRAKGPLCAAEEDGAETSSSAASDSDSDTSSDNSEEDTGEEVKDLAIATESHLHVRQKPTSPSVLIFTASATMAHRLTRMLEYMKSDFNHMVKALTPLTARAQKKRILSSFRLGDLPVLVTTDLLAHGMDFANLTHVINYDIPRSLEEYIHRVGRTARAGRAGTAITLVEHKQGKWFWTEMAKVDRGRGKKVTKPNALTVTNAEREAFIEALANIGKEAIDETRRPERRKSKALNTTGLPSPSRHVIRRS